MQKTRSTQQPAFLKNIFSLTIAPESFFNITEQLSKIANFLLLVKRFFISFSLVSAKKTPPMDLSSNNEEFVACARFFFFYFTFFRSSIFYIFLNLPFLYWGYTFFYENNFTIIIRITIFFLSLFFWEIVYQILVKRSSRDGLDLDCIQLIGLGCTNFQIIVHHSKI